MGRSACTIYRLYSIVSRLVGSIFKSIYYSILRCSPVKSSTYTTLVWWPEIFRVIVDHMTCCILLQAALAAVYSDYIMLMPEVAEVNAISKELQKVRKHQALTLIVFLTTFTLFRTLHSKSLSSIWHRTMRPGKKKTKKWPWKWRKISRIKYGFGQRQNSPTESTWLKNNIKNLLTIRTMSNPSGKKTTHFGILSRTFTLDGTYKLILYSILGSYTQKVHPLCVNKQQPVLLLINSASLRAVFKTWTVIGLAIKLSFTIVF